MVTSNPNGSSRQMTNGYNSKVQFHSYYISKLLIIFKKNIEFISFLLHKLTILINKFCDSNNWFLVFSCNFPCICKVSCMGRSLSLVSANFQGKHITEWNQQDTALSLIAATGGIAFLKRRALITSFICHFISSYHFVNAYWHVVWQLAKTLWHGCTMTKVDHT